VEVRCGRDAAALMGNQSLDPARRVIGGQENKVKAEWVRKYDDRGGWTWAPCTMCRDETNNEAWDNESQTYVHVCKFCSSQAGLANVPYPVRVITSKNLKNELGLGNNYFPKKPTQKFFEGLSGRPDKKERINFAAHEVYMTRERAKAEGLLPPED